MNKAYPIHLIYLEYALYGKTPKEIARRYRVQETTVIQGCLTAARYLGSLEFYKFYPRCFEEVLFQRERLLELLHTPYRRAA